MNPNIPFISSELTNSISCLPTTTLSAYILTADEQKYIENLPDDTASTISNQLMIAAIKAGSSLYTQPELNKIYARLDSSYTSGDKVNFKEFLDTKLVGNKIVAFTELSATK